MRDVTRGVCVFPRAYRGRQTLPHWFHILKVLSIAPGGKKQRQKEGEERGRDCQAGEDTCPEQVPRPQCDHSMEPSFCSFTCTRKRELSILQKRGKTSSSRFQKIMEELEGGPNRADCDTGGGLLHPHGAVLPQDR